MAKIAVIGSANADLAVRVARRPLGGETVAGSAVVTSPGGKGANQAAAAALLGGEVSFVGRVGRDGHGALLRDALRSSGVDVAALGDSEAPTSVALIVLTPDGENSIIVAGGANPVSYTHLDVYKRQPICSPATRSSSPRGPRCSRSVRSL